MSYRKTLDIFSLTLLVYRYSLYTYTLFHTHNKHTHMHTQISINVVPLSTALKRPVGLRRDEPNDDPFIPEPLRKVLPIRAIRFTSVQMSLHNTCIAHYRSSVHPLTRSVNFPGNTITHHRLPSPSMPPPTSIESLRTAVWL
jgi:hypothetical protein